jgi:hypothetical protein
MINLELRAEAEQAELAKFFWSGVRHELAVPTIPFRYVLSSVLFIQFLASSPNCSFPLRVIFSFSFPDFLLLLLNTFRLWLFGNNNP